MEERPRRRQRIPGRLGQRVGPEVAAPARMRHHLGRKPPDGAGRLQDRDRDPPALAGSRQFSHFQELGAIKVSRKHIIIRKADFLRSITNSDGKFKEEDSDREITLN